MNVNHFKKKVTVVSHSYLIDSDSTLTSAECLVGPKCKENWWVSFLLESEFSLNVLKGFQELPFTTACPENDDLERLDVFPVGVDASVVGHRAREHSDCGHCPRSRGWRAPFDRDATWLGGITGLTFWRFWVYIDLKIHDENYIHIFTVYWNKLQTVTRSRTPWKLIASCFLLSINLCPFQTTIIQAAHGLKAFRLVLL